MILIISRADDGHVKPVIAELSRRGEEFLIYDPATYPLNSSVTLESGTARVKAHLRWESIDLDLDRVKSVWYRRPGPFELSEQLLSGEADWIRSECNHVFRAMWAGMNALWVSRPDAVRHASLKLMQLRTAMEIGFEIPRFALTNDTDQASRFIASCPDGAVVKVLTTPLVQYTERACTLYTHLITEEDQEELASVRFGPTFLEEFVPKRMDIRVTVFGQRLFAVGIQPVTHDARVDFRRADIYDLPHVPLSLPEELQAKCVALVRRLGLEFGAIDLLLKPDGKYVFLEINPNGQWYWIEWITGTPMVSSLCDMLVSGTRDACGSN